MTRIIILLAILTSSLVAAQPMGLKEGPHGIKERPTHDFTPEQIAELQTKRLTLALDLSSKQQTSVKALQLDIIQKKEANRSDKKRKMSDDEHYAKRISRLDVQIEVKSLFKAILNADQYEKWQKMHHPRKEKKGHSRRGKRR